MMKARGAGVLAAAITILAGLVIPGDPAHAADEVLVRLAVDPAVTKSGETRLAVILVNTADLVAHTGMTIRVTLPKGVSFPVTETRTTCANVLATAPVGRFIEFQADLPAGTATCEVTVGIQGDTPGLHTLTGNNLTTVTGAAPDRTQATFVVGSERIPLTLTVNARPTSGAIPRTGRTVVIRSSATERGGDLRVQVRCVPLSQRGRGDTAACRHRIDGQGRVIIRTFGVPRLRVTVTLTAVPTDSASSTRSPSPPWSQTWQTR